MGPRKLHISLEHFQLATAIDPPAIRIQDHALAKLHLTTILLKCVKTVPYKSFQVAFGSLALHAFDERT